MEQSTAKRGLKAGWGLVLGAVVVCVLLVGGSVLGGSSRLKNAEAEARARGMYLTRADIPPMGNASTNGYLAVQPVMSAPLAHQQTLFEYDLMVELGRERYMRFRIDETIQSLEAEADVLSRAVRMETWVPDMGVIFDGAPATLGNPEEYIWLVFLCSQARRDYINGDLEACLYSYETAQLWANRVACTADYLDIGRSSHFQAKVDGCILNLAADYPKDSELLKGLLSLCKSRTLIDFRQAYSGLGSNGMDIGEAIEEYRRSLFSSSDYFMKYGPVNETVVKAMMLEALIYQFDRTEELQTMGSTPLPTQLELRGGTFIDRGYAEFFMPQTIDGIYFDVSNERSRLVLAALAIMVEELESEKRVNSLEEIGKDVDVRGLHYLRTDAGMQLWGNGPDGVDDGGHFQREDAKYEKDNVVQTMNPSIPLVVFVNWL